MPYLRLHNTQTLYCVGGDMVILILKKRDRLLETYCMLYTYYMYIIYRIQTCCDFTQFYFNMPVKNQTLKKIRRKIRRKMSSQTQGTAYYNNYNLHLRDIIIIIINYGYCRLFSGHKFWKILWQYICLPTHRNFFFVFVGLL